MKKLIILLVLISSCNNKVSNDKKILRLPLSTNASTLDPAISYDQVSATIVYKIYEQLYEYDPIIRPYKLKPLLAESMPTVKNNGKMYIIKIKKNIAYHPNLVFKKTRYVTVHDFITQIKRIAFIPTKSNGWWIFNKKIKGINKFRKDASNNFKLFKSLNISGVKAIDNHTLSIELVKPYPQFIYTLAMSFISPIPMEYIEKHKNILNDKTIGTGPFVLDKWSHLSNKFYMKKNNNYHVKGMPYIEAIEFNVIKESQTRWLNFISGKLDIMNIPKDNFSSAFDSNGQLSPKLKDKDINVSISPSMVSWWFSFNMKDPILGKNKYLRLAIAHAINRKKFNKLFTNDRGIIANSIYSPAILNYNNTRKLPFSYNIAKAKEYLKKAGYPNGKGLPIIKYDTRSANTLSKQIAEFIKMELKIIGINLKIIINNFSEFLQKSRKGKLQFWQGGWILDYPDAENILQLLRTKNHSPDGSNNTYYSNKRFDKLFNQLTTTTNTSKKLKMLSKMEDIVQDDLPWIMGYFGRNYLLYYNRVEGLISSDIINNFAKYIKIAN